MESSEGTSRRSERKRKRKESYSPEGKKEGKKNKQDGQKTQNKSKLFANRPYDILPNGEPFSCHLCRSPFVVNPISKGVKKTGRSRHTPLPQIRTDRNTGREMTLCNACVQIFDRPQRRVIKTATVPSEDEKNEYLGEVEHFVKTLKALFDDPLVEKLFCPVSQKKLCGCLQKYIQSTGNSHVPVFITLMKEAIELRKEKSYPVSDNNKKVKLIGLGNGHKKSKRYEEFVLTKRRVLKDNMRLCERATQKILMYSNNFLHKRLKTENRPCRVERTRGKAALGQLPDLHTMMDQHCCTDNCVMLALTHKRLLQDWRDRALQGQQEARRVMAEMLTPAGATHINCYNFISMVTGCSQTTIARVYNQMIDTGGLRDPPEHGMKRVWQEHYKHVTKTSYGSKETSSSSSSAESLSQEGTSQNNQTDQNTGISVETLNAARQHKLAWIQDMAKKQIQQQQIASQLQDLISKKKNNIDQQNLTTEHLQRKADDISHGQSIKTTNSLAIEQLQNNPLSNVFNLNHNVIESHGQVITSQGHHYSGQGHMQHVLLNSPPQYGIHHSSLNRQWNQSQLNFPINVNQTNYLLTGDHQVLPVIPVFKQGLEGQVFSTSIPVTRVTVGSGNQSRPVHIAQNDTVQTVDKHVKHVESFVTSQIAHGNTNSCIVNDLNSLINPVQTQALRQYQIVSDHGVQLLNVPSSVYEQSIGEKLVAVQQQQSTKKPEVLVSTSQASLDQSKTTNPNIYFHLVPQSPEKVRQSTEEKIISRHMPTTTVSEQNGDLNFLVKPISSTAQISEREVEGDATKDTAQNANSRSKFHKPNGKDVLIDKSMSDNSSTLILDHVPNQAGPVLESTNQTQLIVPVSFYPSSGIGGVGSEQIPSQIQISFQTCSTESDQPGFTQQLILPHSNVVTLPLMQPTSNNDLTMATTTADISTSNKEFMGQDTVSNDGVPKHSKNFPRENLQQDFVESRIKTTVADKHIRTESTFSKSRNCSGNSRKSRNSSGSSDKYKRSAVYFSDTSKLESQNDNGHANLRPEAFTDFHFATKLNKNRHRQYSGNSEHGDRSRKSSGNSVFSETSSHTSGLTLSNLASPNIFLDKEKGIFFIQSVDGIDEIDNNQLVDLIQAVEADQANAIGTEKHAIPFENEKNNCELIERYQSDKQENVNVDVSRNAVIGKPKLIKHVGIEDILSERVEPHGAGFDIQHSELMRHGSAYPISDAKLSEEFCYKTNLDQAEKEHNQLDTEVVGETLGGKEKHDKRKVKKSSKKSLAADKNLNHERKHKNMQAEVFISNGTLSKEARTYSRSDSSSMSFVPIAPKIMQKVCNSETSVRKEQNSRLSHSAPVLSSLLSKKPMF